MPEAKPLSDLPLPAGLARRPEKFTGKLVQTERTYLAMKHMILENELRPGEFVLQEELAERLGVSRTPIREALMRLAREGLIEVRPRHGMQVLPVSTSAIREIYDVLTALEARAARIVAARGGSETVLAELDQAVRDMDAALEADDLSEWAAADDRFHRALVAASGNQRLIQMVAMVVDQAHRVRKLTLKLRPKPTSSNEAHRAVIAAIRARDPATAHTVHERHREESGNMLIALLEHLEIRAA